MKGLTKKLEDLQELAIKECPLGHDFINSHCPVNDFRKLTGKNFVNHFKNMSEEEIDDIFIYHEDCSSYFA